MKSVPFAVSAAFVPALLLLCTPDARASSVSIESTIGVMEPSSNSPSDKDGCPPTTGSADPEEALMQIEVVVTSPIDDPTLTLVDTNAPTGDASNDTRDDLTMDLACTSGSVTGSCVLDIAYLDGSDDGVLTAGTWYVYVNLDKTGYIQGATPADSSNCRASSVALDTERYTATLDGSNIEPLSDDILTTMVKSTSIKQNDFDWLGTVADASGSLQLDDSFCIRSKYEQSSAQTLDHVIAHSYYDGSILRLDSLDLYYYDTNGSDPGSIESCVPGVMGCAGTVPEATFTDTTYLSTVSPPGNMPADFSSGDHVVTNYCFTVIGFGGTFFSPYLMTQESPDALTGTWKVDSGFGQAVIFEPPALQVTKQVTDITPVGGDCTNTAEVYIGQDLAASGTTEVGTCEVTASTEITYTIEVCNDGGPASGVSVSDVIPTGFVYVSASPAPDSAPTVGDNGTVIWDLGDLAANTCGSDPVQLTLTVSTD